MGAKVIIMFALLKICVHCAGFRGAFVAVKKEFTPLFRSLIEGFTQIEK